MAKESKSGESEFGREREKAERAQPCPPDMGPEVSDSTRRAKWICSQGEHEDRPGQTLATRDHDVIVDWVTGHRSGSTSTVLG